MAIYLNNPDPLAPVANTMSNVITGLAMRKADANIRAKEAETQRAWAERQAEAGRKHETQQAAIKSHDEYIRKGYRPYPGGGIIPINAEQDQLVESPYGVNYLPPEEEPPEPKKLEVKVGNQVLTGIKTGNPEDNFMGVRGWKQASEAPRYRPTTTVNNTTNVDMTKKTQSDLEGEIVQGHATLEKLGRVNQLYNPNFLEWTGKGKAFLNDKLSKAGMATGPWFQQYNKWKAEVNQHTLMWRKFITGVAGGEREMADIEKTTINTKYDSPASFKAKSEQIKIFTEAAIKRAKFLLAKGFDVAKMEPEERAGIVEKYPLSDFGYKDADIPAGRNSGLGDYEPGAIYEDESGAQMRFDGYGKNGEPIWGAP